LDKKLKMTSSEIKRNQFLDIDYKLENFWQEHQNTTSVFCKCPKQDCHGFVLQGSESPTCTTCNTLVCIKCREIMDQDHECDGDTIETIKLIESETKACPGCGIQIHKIQGCYQMWCTQCHTTFHYRTGEILREPIHNPHYIEWLKTMPQTEECLEFDVISLDNLESVLQERHTSTQEAKLVTSSRKTSEYLVGLKHEARHQLAKLNNVMKSHNTRIEYILNGMTILEYKKTLYAKFKMQNKLKDVITLVETIVLFIHSFLYHFVFETMTLTEIKTRLEEFVLHINDESNRLVKLYASKFPNIRLVGYRLQPEQNSGREYIHRHVVEKIKDDCDICCETTRIIKCDECQYKCCIDCFERYTFDSINEASCIQCKVYFDRDVLVRKLGHGWYEKKYKLHLYTLLFQREETQFEKSCEFYKLQQEREKLYKEWKYLLYKEYTETFSLKHS
jgi:hypothetical protein